MRRILIVCLALFSAGCAERGMIGLGDKSAVETPVYGANKVWFMKPDETTTGAIDGNRYSDLVDAYQIAAELKSDGRLTGLRRSIQNRQPLSIVVSGAYVPATLKQCNGRLSDFIFGSDGRDIAVLLDITSGESELSTIAVWYQRGVKPDSLLNFNNLLVYSNDAWDAKFAPLFRLRLVDVSSERNTAVREMLDRANSTGASLSGLAGAPGAGPLLALATQAAQSVLANEKNKTLVDFTFQLYGGHLLAESGGVPLGVLQTGGLVVSAVPCNQSVTYWENPLKFDHRTARIRKGASIEAVPYLFATVIGADLAVPQIVRDRSSAIMQRLTDPQVAQREIGEATRDATRLEQSLEALSVRERFRRAPSVESFKTLVTATKGQWSSMDLSLQLFFLNAFYQVTGRTLDTAAAYETWLDNCPGATFNTESMKFSIDDSIGTDRKKCWP
ncbi:hypothetical protein [Sphingomonas sp. UNC305MFCol5.2]|uniref:hypothetical protein n=1 Tax=Sphingomonas sp. UNC305MFCol5.2 TaxID=1449076 RepID=UPI001E59435D|nr:hypothetical protein [Sphingomonas sp. UNC305MFCol5.2]